MVNGMDPLTQQLMQRQMTPDPQGQPQASLPQSPQSDQSVVPTIPAKVPQRAKRFQNAQQIQDSYRNGWSPNPILLRALLGNR